MKKTLLIAALLFSLNASAQKFTTSIAEPICDTFTELTIEILSNVAPIDGNLDSLTLYWRKVSKSGFYIEGNKKIKNDTATVNPLKRKIIQNVSGSLGAIVPVKEVKAPNKLAAIKNSN